MVARNGFARSTFQPAPVVTHVGSDEAGDDYNVHSERSDKDYLARVDRDGKVRCFCPATASCYHVPHIALAHQRRAAALRTVDDIDGLVTQIKRLCESDCEPMSPYEKDRAIWELAKRIEIARRRERESGAERRAA
jgi:hypothetical protein